MVKLYQTIRKGGKLYVRGYAVNEHRNGVRMDFSFEETTIDATFERLRRMRDAIDANHARKDCHKQNSVF